jgi:lipopolysaccharide export LptBFGC system permease protein LptF
VKIISRYVSRSVLTSTLYAVIVLSVVLVLGNIFKEALDLLINRNVPVGYILFFMACVLPFSLTFTVPWGFLTAILLVLGRMSADHETIALRASGISLRRTSVPVIAIGAALSLLCVWLNSMVNPRAELAMRESLANMARSSPNSLFVPGEVIDAFSGKKLFFNAKRDGWLVGVTLFEEDEEGAPLRVTRARFGRIAVSKDGEYLILTLRNANFEWRSKKEPHNIAKISHGVSISELETDIPLQQLVRSDLLWRPLRTYTLPELYDFLARDLENEEWPKRSAVRTEVNKRFSLGFASLAFALIAIPLGVVAQRRETSAGFGMSLAIAFSYFFFVALADALRDNATALPYVIVWVPNALFLALGTWLIFRLDHR